MDDISSAEFYELAFGLPHYFVNERDGDGKVIRTGSAVGDKLLEQKARPKRADQLNREQVEVLRRGELNNSGNKVKDAALNRLKQPEQWAEPVSSAALGVLLQGQTLVQHEVLED